MSKKDYQKPSMAVIMLRHQVAILETSGGGVEASRSSYGAANKQTWDDSEPE